MYEWQESDGETALSLVINRSPLEFTWGYYLTNTLSELLEGRFCWFESPVELLEFILNVETEIYLCKDEDVEQYRDLEKSIKQAILSGNPGKGLNDNLREKINELLSIAEVSWWGKFSDLYSGKDLFSRDLVAGFYESVFDDYSRDESSLSEEDIAMFVEYCREYGRVQTE